MRRKEMGIVIVILLFIVILEAIIISKLIRLYRKQFVKSELLSGIIEERVGKNDGENSYTGNIF